MTYLNQTDTRYGTMIFFCNDDPIGACLIHYGEWAQQEMDLLEGVLSENSNVLDVGANIGTHSLFFSHICPKGNVIAFEPQQFIFNLLTTNATINQRFNIYPVNAAVSDNNTKIQMVNPSPFTEQKKMNYGEFKVNHNADRGMYTSVIKLDNYKDSLTNVDLIKIDVEGMEVKVLDGAKELIERFTPVLYLEFSEKDGNPSLIEKVESLDYIPYIHIYNKHNPINHKNQTLNVWEEDGFILEKHNMHKRYDASIICFHKNHNQPEGLSRVNKDDTLFDLLFKDGLI